MSKYGQLLNMYPSVENLEAYEVVRNTFLEDNLTWVMSVISILEEIPDASMSLTQFAYKLDALFGQIELSDELEELLFHCMDVLFPHARACKPDISIGETVGSVNPTLNIRPVKESLEFDVVMLRALIESAQLLCELAENPELPKDLERIAAIFRRGASLKYIAVQHRIRDMVEYGEITPAPELRKRLAEYKQKWMVVREGIQAFLLSKVNPRLLG